MSKVNTFSKTLIAGSLMACTTVASAGFSANVAMTTNYMWRGVTQTNGDPAIQGGFDFSADNGIYLGTWGSNVEFGGPEHMEMDLYGGWAGKAGPLDLDIGIIHYGYFHEAGSNFDEGYFGVSYKVFSAKVSHDFDNKNTYVEAGLDFDLPQGASLALHAGHYDFDAGGNYTDYSVGVSKEFGGFGFDLSYYDTNDSSVDSALVFTLSKSI
jgi:uncharacterized protein (TIGR02001 family)